MWKSADIGRIASKPIVPVRLNLSGKNHLERAPLKYKSQPVVNENMNHIIKRDVKDEVEEMDTQEGTLPT